MNACEYFEMQLEGHRQNLERAEKRNATAIERANIQLKIRFYTEAVEALKKMEEMRDDLK